MTAPIQEPNLYRHTSGLQWGQNQLFRRPAPVSGEINSYAWLDHGFVGAIPSGALTSVTVNDPYDEGAIYEVDEAGYSLGLSDGCITWAEPGEYLAFGHLLFDDTITAGTKLAAVLDLGNGCVFSATRHGNVNIADTVTQDFRIPVSCPIWDPTGATGPNSVRLMAYHDEGSDLNVSSAQLHVVRMTGASVTFFT